jgi:hypothetical protein
MSTEPNTPYLREVSELEKELAELETNLKELAHVYNVELQPIDPIDFISFVKSLDHTESKYIQAHLYAIYLHILNHDVEKSRVAIEIWKKMEGVAPQMPVEDGLDVDAAARGTIVDILQNVLHEQKLGNGEKYAPIMEYARDHCPELLEQAKNTV